MTTTVGMTLSTPPVQTVSTHTRRAARLYARITANVDAFHGGTVGYDEFNATAIALWADIAAKGMTAAVCKIMRGEAGVS